MYFSNLNIKVNQQTKIIEILVNIGNKIIACVVRTEALLLLVQKLRTVHKSHVVLF